MNTTTSFDVTSQEVSAKIKTEENFPIAVLTLDELASVAGGKVNEYEGQHR